MLKEHLLHFCTATMWRQISALMEKTIQEPRRSIHSTWQTWNVVPQSALLNPVVFLDKKSSDNDNKKKLCSGVMVLEWMRLQSAKPLTDPSPNSAPQDLRGMKWCSLDKKQLSTTKQPLLLLKSTMWKKIPPENPPTKWWHTPVKQFGRWKAITIATWSLTQNIWFQWQAKCLLSISGYGPQKRM